MSNGAWKPRSESGAEATAPCQSFSFTSVNPWPGPVIFQPTSPAPSHIFANVIAVSMGLSFGGAFDRHRVVVRDANHGPVLAEPVGDLARDLVGAARTSRPRAARRSSGSKGNGPYARARAAARTRSPSRRRTSTRTPPHTGTPPRSAAPPGA